MTDRSSPRGALLLAVALAATAGATCVPASAQTGLGTPGGGSSGGINTTGAGTGLSSPGTIRGSTSSGPGFSNPNAISNPGVPNTTIGTPGTFGGGLVSPSVGVPPPAPTAMAPSGRISVAPRPR
ncbi:hypothetical protein [Lichenicola sp.]|uniref:hypothetical protein n=1 Tax=Lichenicola sp. TaxID=2804529 RepID=UPI003AFFA83A